jgi:hypothetical protein
VASNTGRILTTCLLLVLSNVAQDASALPLLALLLLLRRLLLGDEDLRWCVSLGWLPGASALDGLLLLLPELLPAWADVAPPSEGGCCCGSPFFTPAPHATISSGTVYNDVAAPWQASAHRSGAQSARNTALLVTSLFCALRCYRQCRRLHGRNCISFRNPPLQAGLMVDFALLIFLSINFW